MDRVMTYVGATPRSVDILNTNRNTMVALGMALQAILGTSTLVDGLACVPTAPASMQVSVGPGSIMSVAAVDASAYGALAADTTDQIVKQGIQLASQLLTLTAPSTSGYSQNYLVSAAFAEVDGNAVSLPYYNPSAPATPIINPTPQNTVRQGQVVITLTPGVAAASGSQTTPATPSGATPLYVITVANGQTTITSANISTVAGAPFIGDKLPAKLSQTTADGRYLRQANNLSDLANIATALSNLGFKLTAGTNQWSLALGGVCTIKFGTVASVPAEGSAAVTFTNPFATAAFVALSTTNRTSIDPAGNYASYAGNLSTTGLTVYNDVGANVSSPAAVPITWLAIGT